MSKIDYLCHSKNHKKTVWRSGMTGVEVEKPKLITKQEAAQFLRVSPRTIDRYCKSGILQSIKFGGSIRFIESQIYSLVTKQGISGGMAINA